MAFKLLVLLEFAMKGILLFQNLGPTEKNLGLPQKNLGLP